MAQIIGTTTKEDVIGRILGTEDYGLVCETEMGKYYAKFSEGGGFEENYVRLISHEQASELEKVAVAAIENVKIDTTAPGIDMESFNKRLADIQCQVNETAKQMGKEIKYSLENAGFHPTF